MTETAPARPASHWGRWVVLILAALIGSTLLSTFFVLRCAPDVPPVSVASTPAPAPAAADSGSPTRAEMRNVNYHVDADIVLHIRHLAGRLVPVRKEAPPVFEDGASYLMQIEGAEIFVDTSSLSGLINRYVFGYRGAPIRDVKVSVDGQELIQKGKLGNASFTIRSAVSVTPAGEIRLHPVDVKVLGINADGLMRKFGLELDDLLKVDPNRGIRVEENDLVLDVTTILPPPRIRGKLESVRLTPGGMVQRFGTSDSLAPRKVFGESRPSPNYMYYLGGIIRFGKLTMTGTDLLIFDADPGDPFEFFLQRYFEQLVAGEHHTTPEDGLVVRMPDLNDLNR
jgi:hypothetical protein